MNIEFLRRLCNGGDTSLDEMVSLLSDDEDNKLFSKEWFVAKYPNVDYTKIFFVNKGYIMETVYYDKEKYIYISMPIYSEKNDMIETMFSEKDILKSIEFSEKSTIKKDVQVILHRFPESFRFDVFRNMIEDNFIKEEQIYSIFRELFVYNSCGFERLDKELIKRILSAKSEADVCRIKESISGLPQKVVIYRGEADCSTPCEEGPLSWSLSPKIALKFAIGFSDKGARIVKAEVGQ